MPFERNEWLRNKISHSSHWRKILRMFHIPSEMYSGLYLMQNKRRLKAFLGRLRLSLWSFPSRDNCLLFAVHIYAVATSSRYWNQMTFSGFLDIISISFPSWLNIPFFASFLTQNFIFSPEWLFFPAFFFNSS